MNTTINESVIADYLDKKKAQLTPAFPELQNLDVSIRSGEYGPTISGYLGDRYMVCFGQNFVGAALQMRAKIGQPADRAKAAREHAAKLLAEAEALEATISP